MAKTFSDILELVDSRKLEGLHGQGASPQEIASCEEVLNLKFPTSFKDFLSEYGWGYFGPLEVIAGVGSDIPIEWENGVSLRSVVQDERSGPQRMPIEVIPFCQNGAGDWYAVESATVENGESPVYFLSHESAAAGGLAKTECADSFADWLFEKLS